MLSVQIDTVEHRQILGFEVGTRQQFDTRHAGDPLWVFVDNYQARYRANLRNFLIYPFNYKVDLVGNILISYEPPIVVVDEIPDVPVGCTLIKGRDGRYLKGDDGQYLYGYQDGYAPPPDGAKYLVDPDNFLLKDKDNAYLLDPILPGESDSIILTDTDAADLTDDGDDATLTE